VPRLVHACRVWKSRCEQRRRGLAIFHGRMVHLAAKTWMAWCDYRSFMLSKLTSAERMAVALQRCVVPWSNCLGLGRGPSALGTRIVVDDTSDCLGWDWMRWGIFEGPYFSLEWCCQQN
jgi:hypothetical protein